MFTEGDYVFVEYPVFSANGTYLENRRGYVPSSSIKTLVSGNLYAVTTGKTDESGTVYSMPSAESSVIGTFTGETDVIVLAEVGHDQTEYYYVEYTDSYGLKRGYVASEDLPVVVENIDFAQHEVKLYVGDTFTLQPLISPSGALCKDVIWENSDTQGAVISFDDGQITALSEGEVTITATIAVSGKSCSCRVRVVSNKYFEITSEENLIKDVENVLGTGKKSMVHDYTPAECIRKIIAYDQIIVDYCNRFMVPKEIIQTLLLRELWCVNQLDAVADIAVKQNFSYLQKFEEWLKLPPYVQTVTPCPYYPILSRSDCSTGIGQMFAWVAINAHNLAISNCLIEGNIYDPDDWHDCKDVWFNLHNNDDFAIKMMVLQIYDCADRKNLGYDFLDYTDDEITSIFSAYNGYGDAAKKYGEECFDLYLIFKKY